MLYLAEGGGPKSQPQQQPGAEEGPTPLEVVTIDWTSRQRAQKIPNGHEHPAGVHVLLVRGLGNPTSLERRVGLTMRK